MDVKIDMQFKCPNCNTIINHNYTQSDLLNKSCLELICQNCNTYQEISTKTLIEKAKQAAIEEIKRNFKTK